MLKHSSFIRCLSASLITYVGLIAGAWAQTGLGSYNIDTSRLGIAGISSGGFMAVQAQINYPEFFKKAAIIAGGPYACAEDLDLVGSNGYALFDCMNDSMNGYSATEFMSQENIQAWSNKATNRSKNFIKNNDGYYSLLNYLNGGIVYFLHGINDTTVIPVVVEAAIKVYKGLKTINTLYYGNGGMTGAEIGPVNINIVDDGERNFAHTFPTREPRKAGEEDDCNQSVYPYIGHCGIDGAQLIFSNLFGSPVAEVQDQAANDVLQFSQDGLFSTDSSMDTQGFSYVPTRCAQGESCGILVALHGCNQAAASMNPVSGSKDPGPVGNRFATQTQLNRWADAYNIIVMYPQVKPTVANGNGCWDWFGYTGNDFNSRSGKQIVGLVNMVRKIGYKEQ